MRTPAFAVNQFGQTIRLISLPDPFVQPFMNGPVFGVSNYTSSPAPTQITDAIQRAEFGNKARSDWHTLLAPSIKTTRTMVLTADNFFFAFNDDGTCCLFVLASDPAFSAQLFPGPSGPDNTTVIGAAEVAGDITTKDISTFMFPNTYLYENDDPNQCCVLGFHSFDFEAGDATNGNQLRFFIMNYSSWISPGLFGGGFEDITAHSHEIAETFNDPFVGFDGIHNITPFWLINGQCQDLMEVGDVSKASPPMQRFPSPSEASPITPRTRPYCRGSSSRRTPPPSTTPTAIRSGPCSLPLLSPAAANCGF